MISFSGVATWFNHGLFEQTSNIEKTPKYCQLLIKISWDLSSTQGGKFHVNFRVISTPIANYSWEQLWRGMLLSIVNVVILSYLMLFSIYLKLSAT